MRGSTGPGEAGSCVSLLSDSGVIAGSPAPPELIRAIIDKLNMKELVVSGSWAGAAGRGQARPGVRTDCVCRDELGPDLQGRPSRLALLPESRCEKVQSDLISSWRVIETGDRGVNITHT